MELTKSRHVILRVIEENKRISSENIVAKTDAPKDHVMNELGYLERMGQIYYGAKTMTKKLDINLTKDGQETLDNNRTAWKKIKSKMKGKGFSFAGFGINL